MVKQLYVHHRIINYLSCQQLGSFETYLCCEIALIVWVRESIKLINTPHKINTACKQMCKQNSN